MSVGTRRIAHLDMDAFYASVEWLRYPQLKALPMVIGGGRRKEDDLIGRLNVERPERHWNSADLADIPVDFFPLLRDYVGRGVITTATYAARPFGIGSAMGLMKAAKLCPQAFDDGAAYLSRHIHCAPLERFSEGGIVKDQAAKLNRLRVTRREVPVDVRVGPAAFERRVRLGHPVGPVALVCHVDQPALRGMQHRLPALREREEDGVRVMLRRGAGDALAVQLCGQRGRQGPEDRFSAPRNSALPW